MSQPLDRFALRQPARVSHLSAPETPSQAERVRRLADLGFVPGAPVAVLARAWPGGDPLVVRVGESRFALRRAEAACIAVHPAPSGPA